MKIHPLDIIILMGGLMIGVTISCAVFLKQAPDKEVLAAPVTVTQTVRVFVECEDQFEEWEYRTASLEAHICVLDNFLGQLARGCRKIEPLIEKGKKKEALDTLAEMRGIAAGVNTLCP